MDGFFSCYSNKFLPHFSRSRKLKSMNFSFVGEEGDDAILLLFERASINWIN